MKVNAWNLLYLPVEAGQWGEVATVGQVQVQQQSVLIERGPKPGFIRLNQVVQVEPSSPQSFWDVLEEGFGLSYHQCKILENINATLDGTKFCEIAEAHQNKDTAQVFCDLRTYYLCFCAGKARGG